MIKLTDILWVEMRGVNGFLTVTGHYGDYLLECKEEMDGWWWLTMNGVGNMGLRDLPSAKDWLVQRLNNIHDSRTAEVQAYLKHFEESGALATPEPGEPIHIPSDEE